MKSWVGPVVVIISNRRKKTFDYLKLNHLRNKGVEVAKFVVWHSKSQISNIFRTVIAPLCAMESKWSNCHLCECLLDCHILWSVKPEAVGFTENKGLHKAKSGRLILLKAYYELYHM
jgi:hypothetical protein